MSGCYVAEGVTSHEVGLYMKDGMQIKKVLKPGRYTSLRFFAALKKVDCSAKTLEWSDPDLLTKDKQPVNFKVAVTYSRKKDENSIRSIWEDYNTEAQSDKALAQLVLNRIPRVAKQITTMFTLDEMLGITDEQGGTKGREILQQTMFDLLEKELAEFHVELKDFGANDIGPDPSYTAKLTEKAVSKIAVEVANQKTKELNEKVKQEQAQTLVEMEIARRNNMVATEKNKIYQLNPQAYELEKMKILRDTIGNNDKLIFVEKGTDITLLLGNDGIIPVGK